MLLKLATTSICLNWQFDNVCYKLAHVAKVKDYEDTPGPQSAAVSMLLLLRSSTRPCWTAGPASSWSPHTLVVRKPTLVQDDGSTGTSIDCDRWQVPPNFSARGDTNYFVPPNIWHFRNLSFKTQFNGIINFLLSNQIFFLPPFLPLLTSLCLSFCLFHTINPPPSPSLSSPSLSIFLISILFH